MRKRQRRALKILNISNSDQLESCHMVSGANPCWVMSFCELHDATVRWELGEMSDLINILRARREERSARDEELRARLKEFEALLRDATGEREIYGTSGACTLENIGPDDHCYGFLT